MTTEDPIDGSGPIVPLVGLRQQYRALASEIDTAMSSVIQRSAFVGGRELDEFEEWFAAYCGVPHAVGVSSGTMALELALRSLGVGPGDEVVTSANTFIATVAAIVAAGARPVLVDVQEHTANMDPTQLCRAVTARTKAIIPVHLYGLPAPMQEIVRIAAVRGIAVVEDAAQAHGACYRGVRVGSIGAAGCFSFYPSKNLGAFGDGGLVTTRDAAVARDIRKLRDHGRVGKYDHVVFGCTGRLDNLQAAVLGVQAGHLEAWNDRRRQVAAIYRAQLPPQLVPFEDPDGQSVYHIFAVRAPRRDEFREHLGARGIESAVHYPLPLHLQPVCRSLGYGPGDFPVAERLAREVVSLPMHPFLTPIEVEYVCAAAAEAFR